MERAIGRAPVVDSDQADQAVVLHGMSWAQYEGLLRARGEAPRPLMAFLDGELEIVTTSRTHELVKKMLARLLEAYAEEAEVELIGFGQATLKRRARKAGCEPDEWYCIDREKPAPDLAIEVVVTSGGVDKLEIYRRLGAAEVWFWIEGKIGIHVLVDGRYEARERSKVLPRLDVGGLARRVMSTHPSRQTSAVRAFRRTLRRDRS